MKNSTKVIVNQEEIIGEISYQNNNNLLIIETEKQEISDLFEKMLDKRRKINSIEFDNSSYSGSFIISDIEKDFSNSKTTIILKG